MGEWYKSVPRCRKMQRLSQLTAKDFPQQAGEHAQMCACFRHLWRIISSTERCVKNRAYLPPLVEESVLPDGVTFCYPIPAAPSCFTTPAQKKPLPHRVTTALCTPPGWNLMTRYMRVIVFTNSCQALILRLPAVLHTPRFPCHRHADACIDVGCHAG